MLMSVVCRERKRLKTEVRGHRKPQSASLRGSKWVKLSAPVKSEPREES